jgi:hypothetical protein
VVLVFLHGNPAAYVAFAVVALLVAVALWSVCFAIRSAYRRGRVSRGTFLSGFTPLLIISLIVTWFAIRIARNTFGW